MATFRLLELLLTDRGSSNIMIVGCYRSEEVDDIHTLTQLIQNMKEKSSNQYVCGITEIKLGELSVQDINNLLSDLLNIDRYKTFPLAELCHKRSNGNPLHLTQFLRMLEDESLIVFNVGAFRWTFDLDKIVKKTSATMNVVELVTSRLEGVSEDLQELLHMSACLGSSFELETLSLVWTAMKSSEDSTADDFEVYIEESSIKGILEVVAGANRYRWTHDNIQNAAMDMGQRKIPDMQFRMGLLLLEKFHDGLFDSSIVFVIANLLQSSDGAGVCLGLLDKGNQQEIVKLYLQATQKAVSCSAFHSAAHYIKTALSLFPEDEFFRSNNDLALELYSLGAEIESSLGNDVTMNNYCDQVFFHCPNILDNIRCYKAKLSRLGNTKKTKTACSICIDILDKLKTCKIPRNATSQMIGAIIALQTVKDVDTEALLSLPKIKDRSYLATMSILNSVSLD